MKQHDHDAPMGPQLPPTNEQCHYGHLDWAVTSDQRKREYIMRCKGRLGNRPCPDVRHIPWQTTTSPKS